MQFMMWKWLFTYDDVWKMNRSCIIISRENSFANEIKFSDFLTINSWFDRGIQDRNSKGIGAILMNFSVPCKLTQGRGRSTNPANDSLKLIPSPLLNKKISVDSWNNRPEMNNSKCEKSQTSGRSIKQKDEESSIASLQPKDDTSITLRSYQVWVDLLKICLFEFFFLDWAARASQEKEHYSLLGNRKWENIHRCDVDQTHEGPDQSW